MMWVVVVKVNRIITIILLSLISSFLLWTAFTACSVSPASASYNAGVWDNFNYDQPASYWTSAVRECGGSSGVLDLVVAQAQNGIAALPFPLQGTGTFRSVSDQDLVEPYLDAFDREGLGVILSIQPLSADVNDLIGIILGRYGQHKSVIGVNIDLEWKKTGTSLHVNNQERDAWTTQIERFNPGLKLFLTYYQDYTYFPDDNGKMVVLYDGLGDTQENILKAYGEMAKHFANVGIYTGYPSSQPQTASDEMILNAAPNTRYILHTDNQNSDPATTAAGGLSLQSAIPKAKTGFSMPTMSGFSGMSGFSANSYSMPTLSGGTGSGNGGIFSNTLGSSLGGNAKSTDSGSQEAMGGNWQSTWQPAGKSFMNGFGSGSMAIPVKSLFS